MRSPHCLLPLALALGACSSDRDLFRDVPIADVVTDRASPTSDVPQDAPADTAVPTDAPLDASSRADAADATTPADVAADTAAPSDAPADSARDASVADAAPDAAPTPDGRCTPTIDGAVAADWPSNAIVATNAVATAWGPDDQLRAIRVCYDATNLYLGLEGSSQAMNGVVVYLDRDFAGGVGGTATGISLLSALTDHAGTLDSRISAALTINAAGFGAEGAWGFAGLPTAPLAAAATSDTVGLRLFWPTGGTPDRRTDFAWMTGAQTVCAGSGATAACETAIAWTQLYEGARPTSTTVALFARINNGDGTMTSNQTLPQDDPMNPRTVSRVLQVPVR
jgi:hypothetical protein